ncbi:MAG: hypothetical protein IJK52_12060, partial [Oscillospiraceae bacterium]|nr:hypothetical protein [Oscillospiraceae bacterium]
MSRRLFHIILAWLLLAAQTAPNTMAAGTAWFEPVSAEKAATERYVKEAAVAETEVTWEDLAF